MVELNYVVEVKSLGDCAGTVTVVFNGDRPYIKDVLAEYGVFECRLSLQARETK
jgi:hypothetical protein